MNKLFSNPVIIGLLGAIITALVVFVYSMFTQGQQTISVRENPDDPDSPTIETSVPSGGPSIPVIVGASIFVGILSGSLASIAMTTGSDLNFDIEEILDEQF